MKTARLLLFVPILVSLLFSQKVQASPALIFGVDSPETMIFGMRPFEIKLSVYNPGSETALFDITVDIFHAGTDGSIYPYSFDGELYNMVGNQEKMSLYWRGQVPPGETFYMNIATSSGIWEGIYTLAVLKTTDSDEILITREITLTPGSGDPYGTIEMADLNNDKGFKPGEYGQLFITLFAPTKGSFIVDDVTSTGCIIEGLPGGSVSSPNRTYVQFSYYVRVADGQKPGNCTISGEFYIWGHPEKTYQFETKIHIGKSFFLPLVNK